MAKKVTTPAKKMSSATPKPKTPTATLKKGEGYKMANGKIWLIDGTEGTDYKVREKGTKHTALRDIATVDAQLKQRIVSKIEIKK
jgi:hypothetical protein